MGKNKKGDRLERGRKEKINYRGTLSEIKKRIEQGNERRVGLFEDGYTLVRGWMEEDLETGIKANREMRRLVGIGIEYYAKARAWENAEKLRRLMYELYKLEAPYKFDAYCLALEYDRPVEEQFYYPRREVLKKFVDELQKLADGELQELFLSCPPRVGKTTLLMFYTTWIMGKNPKNSNLYSSFSDVITEAFYNGIMEILTDETTYHFMDIFPKSEIAKGGTNAKNETIDLVKKKHYPTLTCRSLYGTLNGACDCNGILIGDDLIGGIEEALNKDRLISAWSKVDNNLLPRAKEKARILWCGTRWSISDPAGLRMDLLENDKTFKNRKYVICNLPALNEEDESNFDYKFGVGFSTDYYRQRRASFERNNDTASWTAQYMCQPIERDGTVFEADDFRYFNGVLPEEEADRIFMPVDPAFGGGDFTASPICYQYGDDIYVPDVVFSNEEKNVTQPSLARKASRWGVKFLQIEANKTMQSYVEGVKEELAKLECNTTVMSKTASNQKSKEQRIFDRAPDIRERFIFLESGQRSKEYNQFMQNVFSFKIQGKNKHDDAPDVLAQAADMCCTVHGNNIRIMRRPF